ncbi:GGDEF domain-containing protein [Brevibacillus migulae]|uniref:GGDEF domain-containing protein n=1 Tax=Brevibacillus migulae TaxID=1644114 RepID=UPI00106EAFA7|nr:GGDEF domain-containing protein [Brevibacillus migulae]
MKMLYLYYYFLFVAAITIAYHTFSDYLFDWNYAKAYGLYLFFALLYYHLRIISQKGKYTMDFGINYQLSFGIMMTPCGLFLYELVYRLIISVYRKSKGIADSTEWVDSFFNVGSVVLFNSVGFYLYGKLMPSLQDHVLFYWISFFAITAVSALVSDILIIFAFVLDKQIKTVKEAIVFIRTRNLMDLATNAITNALLAQFLMEHNWKVLIGLFLLSYLVNQSFRIKAQSIEDKLERDKFKEMAYTDYLTGAYNRAYMAIQIEKLNENKESMGIVVADIDHFKQFNDSYNHFIGDRVIQHFAEIVKSRMQGDDLFFRTGGEEFTLFLRRKTFEECEELVESIRLEVEQSTVQAEFEGERIKLALTASFGFVYLNHCEQVSVEKGYVQADELLLASKHSGRNRVTVGQILL